MKMRSGVVPRDVQMSTHMQITQLLTVMRRVEQLCLLPQTSWNTEFGI